MLILASIGKFLLGFWSWLFKAIGQIAAFTIEHWRIILPLVIVGAMCWLIYSARSERDEAREQLSTLQTQIKDAQDKRRVENILKEGSVAAEIKVIGAGHDAEVDQLRKNYEAKLKNQKGATANAKADADRVADNWRDSLRNQVAHNATAGLSGIPQGSGESAASGRDGYTATIGQAYDTLEYACSITTSDYNALHLAWDKACEIYGCR